MKCESTSLVLITGTLVTLSTIMTMLFGFGCGFVSYQWNEQSISYFGPWTAEVIDLEGGNIDDATGTATVYYSKYCYLYKYLEIGPSILASADAPFKTSRAFSMMAIVLALLLFIFAMTACCVDYPAGTPLFKFAAFASVFTMFCSYMTFIIRQSKFCDGCEWGWSAWICIVAGLLWLCSAAALWYMPGESDGPDEMMPAPADASDPSPTDKKEEEE